MAWDGLSVVEEQKKSNYSDIKAKAGDLLAVSFEDAVKKCQLYVQQNADESYRLETDPLQKRLLAEKLISEFTIAYKENVVGYSSKADLRDALINEMVQFGPITTFYYDSSVSEIDVNGPEEIWIEKNGRRILVDEKFNDNEHLEKIRDKLLRNSSTRVNNEKPFVDARTPENYRVNATHASLSPTGKPTIVIRKFNNTPITFEDMVRNEGLTPNMAKLLRIIARGYSSWATIGITGSGKTTTNNAMALCIPTTDTKIIMIENPTEIKIHKVDEAGRILNNVVQFECIISDETGPNVPTMANLIRNAMRESPTHIGLGEMRYPEEFSNAVEARQTGHEIFTTFHAKGAMDAIDRISGALLKAYSNMPPSLANKYACDLFDFIITQERMLDGSRKITDISQCMGIKDGEPVLKSLYTYVVTDIQRDPVTDEAKKVIGYHQRVGSLSESTVRLLVKKGIPRADLEFITSDPESEPEKGVEKYEY